jgi:hypothetical protein
MGDDGVPRRLYINGYLGPRPRKERPPFIRYDTWYRGIFREDKYNESRTNET